MAPIPVEPGANQNALVGEHENGIAVHGQMNARRGAALPVGNFVSLPDLIPGGATGTLSFTVAQPGTYPYRCDFHPDQMKGEITVTQ